MLITQNKERGEIIKCITVVDTKEGFHYKAISKEQKVLYLPKKLKLYQLISIKNFFIMKRNSYLLKVLSQCLMTMVAGLTFTSCSNYVYQVYTLNAEGFKVEKDYLEDQKNDYSVLYNFWSENGTTAFILTNKTNKDMYVVMPQTSFIRNGYVYDYYTDDVVSTSVSSGVWASMSLSSSLQASFTSSDGRMWGLKGVSASESLLKNININRSVSHRMNPLILIPPHSSRSFSGFPINNYVYKECNNYKQNYPNKESEIVTYDKETSPVSFRNRIAYSFDKDCKDIKYIEHHFFIQNLQNISTKAFFKEIKVDNCERSNPRFSPEKKTVKVEKHYSANKFYCSYRKASF